MELKRFLFVASLIFLLGIGTLYAGANRVPFRNGGHQQHKAVLDYQYAWQGIKDFGNVQYTR